MSLKDIFSAAAGYAADATHYVLPVHKTLQEIAAQVDNPALIRSLLSMHANPNAKDSNGETAVHQAARHNHPLTIGVFAGVKANMNTLNNTGNAPLHIAARLGQTESIRALGKAGADMNLRDAKGFTALEQILVLPSRSQIQDTMPGISDRMKTIGALAQAGADMNNVSAVEKLLFMPSAAISLQDKTQMIKAMMQGGLHTGSTYGNDYTLLQKFVLNKSVAAEDKIEAIKIFHAAGADMNARGLGNMTTLQWAAMKIEDPKILQALVNAGADLHAAVPGKSDMTALDFATRAGNHEAAAFLAKAEAMQKAQSVPALSARPMPEPNALAPKAGTITGPVFGMN